ncbi:uncharacterized protein DFL_005558 [Arthrobotrys flagrans]|uniref:Uncharacterized protein n=1 Tax=Arthrobotrys flagrans TaxID=97331 RepID=A0A436ZXS9_ARTFL|nr:hypothetical protein DFL_005558 [Arthrobotrys flagrans]
MMDFSNLTLYEPPLLDSSQAWEPEQILEETPLLETIPRNNESFSFLSGFENSYSSQETEFNLDEGSEFEEELSVLTDEIQSQRLVLGDSSQETQFSNQILEPPEDEDTEGERVILYNSHNKENKCLSTEMKHGKNYLSSQMTLSWDCNSTEIDFGGYKVSSQARYEIQRTFQASTSRKAINKVVADVLRDGTDGCTLGDVIHKMKKILFHETGEIVSSQPLDPFYNGTSFSNDFDNQAQQAGFLEVRKLRGSGYCIRIKLKPLARDAYSHRFNREFGPRFMKLSRPCRFQDTPTNHDLSSLCNAIMQGIDILRRHWEVIHASDASKAEKEANMESYSVIMFAVSGDGLPTQTVP